MANKTRVRDVTNQINLQKWSDLIAECKESGMSVRSWCNEKGIKTNTYFYWQKKLCSEVTKSLQGSARSTSIVAKNSLAAPAFAEVNLSGLHEQTLHKTSDVAVSISLPGMSLQIHNGATEEAVRNIFKVLGRV